jgi:hypothetical protein
MEPLMRSSQIKINECRRQEEATSTPGNSMTAWALQLYIPELEFRSARSDKSANMSRRQYVEDGGEDD